MRITCKLRTAALAACLLASLFGLSIGNVMAQAPQSAVVATAGRPDSLELKSTDRVFWKGKGGENYLILNVFEHDERLKALAKGAKNKLLLDTTLVEGARLLGRPEHAALTNLSILIVSMKDMSEYGGSGSKWTQVGTGTLLKGVNRVELKDVKLEGDLPAQLPTLAFPLQETSTTVAANVLRFMMPTTVHMVAGLPQSLYYENLIAVKDTDQYLFVPEGPAIAFADQFRRNLAFRPTEAQVGSHELKIKVNDWEGKKIAEGTTTVVVTPAATAATRTDPVRVLVIGHSLPSMYWPAYLADFMAAPGNVPVEYIGGIKYWYGDFPDFRNKPPLT
jgi:hypothetical protein